MTRSAMIGIGIGWFAFCVLGSRTAEAGEEAVAALVRSPAPGWPQWQGPRRDGVSDEEGLLGSWPADGPSVAWTATGIGRGYSSPIIVGDTLYITGDQDDHLVISALALDGTLRWQAQNGDAWTRSFPGSRGCCCYDDGKLYHVNAHGRLASFDASTGKELWAVNVLERFGAKNIMWGICESVLVDGPLVFITPVGAKGLMAALDKQSGETAWVAPPIEGDEASYGSPVLLAVGQRRRLVNVSARHAFAVDAANGEVCWQIENKDPDTTISTTPVLAGGRVVLTNVSRNFGAVLSVGLGGDGGQVLWSSGVSVVQGGLISVDDVVYGANVRGKNTGWVAIDAATGEATVLGKLPAGSLIYADQRFYCLRETGEMTLEKLGQDGFVTMGSFQLAKGKDIWAHPVICDGRLYLRHHDTLFCYDVRR